MDQLREESARFGIHPYLLTTGDDGRPHAVAVSIEWQGDRILISTGTRSTANVAARPLLSLLWPPTEAGGYSLIVDGDGGVIGSGPDARILVTPTRGVLHRPGTSSASAARGCGSDCIPLLG
ncbi:pyridoxamine 5'-phosphate oxidase family protein [Methylomicrobium sp. RS1]|uniref:pyridoxamine 5'-phosphate oxidase family protein n=1 Tax=Candidatus Methylomicrobium oryzae TaxID=2802053 RepID=UPI001F302BFF|nr:pyridoxamine 5'-phosphate oxidase family protein [Methylomicrobium sp. RS1]